jgi:hypothetical protein
MVTRWPLLLPLGLLVGCAPAGDEPLEGDDCPTCADKADGGYARGQVVAILRVANEASRTELDRDAGLNAATARAVVEARGEGFASLEALDDVPNVGQTVMDRLLAYGEAQGYLDDDGPQHTRATWQGASGLIDGRRYDLALSCDLDDTTVACTVAVGGMQRTVTGSLGGDGVQVDGELAIDLAYVPGAPDRLFLRDVTFTPTGRPAFTTGYETPASSTWRWADLVDRHVVAYAGRWTGATTTEGAPWPRLDPHAVWTGERMLVWGGYAGGNFFLEDGGAYDPATDRWTPIDPQGAPHLSKSHAVWTGDRLLVRGGLPTSNGLVYSYDPEADRWSSTRPAGAPATMIADSTVWTGSELIVWGGISIDGDETDAGWAYDPASGQVRTLTVTGALSPRSGHLAFWTGREMLVYGGRTEDTSWARDGARYLPEDDRWLPIAQGGPGAPDAGVWAGDRAFVWGHDGTLWSYQLAVDRWTPHDLPPALTTRIGVSLVWTGDKLIVWGGRMYQQDDDGVGAVYDPVQDSWQLMPTERAPEGRADHAAVWTGDELIVWGGDADGNQHGLRTGARFVLED